jgi:hypothetical protein
LPGIIVIGSRHAVRLRRVRGRKSRFIRSLVSGNSAVQGGEEETLTEGQQTFFVALEMCFLYT